MIITLNDKEKALLKKARIRYRENKDYSEDEILTLADEIMDVELEYSLKSGSKAAQLAAEYSELADRIESLLPEE